MKNILPFSNDFNLLDPSDVEANRAGRISEAQLKRLNATISWNQGCTAFIFLPIAGLLCFYALFWLTGATQHFFNLVQAGVFAGVALFLLVIAAKGIWNIFSELQKVNRDRQNNAIRQTQGRLAFDQNGYFFDADGRRLKLPAPAETGGLLPGGLYRVFYLEESGIVLSAEEAFPPSPAQVRTALNEILAHANRFTLDDLAANREGELTPGQRMKPLGLVIGGLVMALFILGIVGFMYFLVIPEVELEANFLPLLVFGVVLSAIGLFSVRNILTGLLDLFFPALKQIQGRVRREKRTSGGRNRSTTYHYVINGQNFRVSPQAYQALVDGWEYRIYYLPRTRKLLSIEVTEVT
ncbi:MAG: hypothetical protein N2117_13280 [Anaerolineales bacterium]|nr:hypothetical protein [Anaerolineales bacterium]MDW8277443.1 hypothetical protein [Anaerolineales bacterium]